MKRIFSASLFFLLFLALSGSVGTAQNGERRIIRSENADYFGGDYDVRKDVTLEACQDICIGDGRCRAFTYNVTAKWCFLKESIGELRSVEGAISGQMVTATAPDPDLMENRRADLDFMPSDLMNTADQLARQIARRTPGGTDAPAYIASGREMFRNKQPAAAADVFRDALALDASSFEAWNGLMSAVYAINTDDWQARQNLQREKISVATNLYLRARTTDNQADALHWLGLVLADRNLWKPAIRSYRASLKLRETARVRNLYETAVAQHGFRLIEHRVDTGSISPQICLVFSDELGTSGLDAADFVRVDGGANLAVTAADRQICVDGVEHGNTYSLTVRSGLPAADGEKIEKTVSLEVYIRDRNPSVRFPGNAYVLPGGPDGAIPVATVNTSTIEAKLYRIGDRALVRSIGDRQFLRQLNAYQGDRIEEETGELIWQGSVEVEQELNHEVTSGIPVSAITPEIKPGVYVLVASAASETRDWEARATQWFIATDLGLSTISGDDGFHVLVRSLTGAEPKSGVNLRLVAANNQILGETETDAAGRARFDAGLVNGRGGMAPALLIAESGDDGSDYSFLDLTRSEIDLTDRGVDGRAPPGPLDVFLTVDRGIYRPGETVYATTMVRDAKVNAVSDIPLTLIVRRPDGKEARRLLIRDQHAGGAVVDLAVAGNAMRGAWRLGIYSDPQGQALSETSYLVEDFLPERLDFKIDTEQESTSPGSALNISVDARYLYGAPAADLSVSGTTRLTPVSKLDAFPGYVFGLSDEEDHAVSAALPDVRTDENGHAGLTATMPEIPSVTRPMTATILAQVTDASGRPVERSITLPVADDRPRLGLRALFEGSAGENSTVSFDVIALAPDGTGTDLSDGRWTLSKVETDFRWYRTDGRWGYRTIHRKRRIADGSINLSGKPVRLDAAVGWGGYEISIEAGDRAIPVSHRFYAGWYVEPKSIDTPESLNITLDRQSYSVGDRAVAHVTAPFAGKAEILIVDSRIIQRMNVDVPEDGAEIELDVTEDWGAGAYILASVYRPMNQAAGRMPARAMGLAWAAVDPGSRRLTVAIDAPQTARPRQSVPVTVSLGNHAEGARAYVTLAAVDVGILNLTGYNPPDPDGWYFGQRKLGVSIRDFYNQLIDSTYGALGRVRSGGDASMMRFDGPAPPDTLMAFHSGVVEVDDNGKAVIDVPVPDFNGTVRLMVVAWSEKAVGHAVAETIFRDPIVVSASFPRFLAPGDRSRLLVDIDNVEKLSGDAVLRVAAGGTIISVPGDQATRNLRLEDAARRSVLLPVDAVAIGETDLTVELNLPDGSVISKAIAVAVRDNEPETIVTSEFELAPGAKLALDNALGDGFLAGSWDATLSVSGAGRLDVAGIVRSLDLYPYGCSEQITSRALPLVYLDDVILAAGLSGDDGVRKRVTDAIDSLVARQNGSGGFGLWSAGTGDLWLDSYVTDFLSRARDKGYPVPDLPLRLALDNLKNQLAYVPDFESGGEGIAYGLYILARHGKAAISDLRYYAKARLGNFATPLAKAQIGAALMLYGDRIEADRVFRVAREDLFAEENRRYRADYGSRLRDGAALLTLASETGSAAIDIGAMSRQIDADWTARPHRSTQDQAWALLAAHALISGMARPNLSFNGESRAGSLFETLSAADLDAGVRLENHGERPVWVVVSRRGVSTQPEPVSSPMGTISRSYYRTSDGEPADLSSVAQGERLVAVVSVSFNDDTPGRLIIDDPLPAGFEIDNPNILRGGDISALDWLDLETAVAHSEFRTDRFVAAYDRPAGGRAKVQFAYIVRAVSPGTFAHPAAIVEDMYLPERRARTKSGWVKIVGPLR